tara:strand:+ start:378 stop:1061 length:684 start_codon:yes stop_codon:yes gene_type:complete
MDRDTRNILNSKQSNMYSAIQPSVDGMSDGQIVISEGSNKQPSLSLKRHGRVYKTYLSADGNQYVDKTLRTNTLEYTHKFIDYRVFKHSFTDDLPGSKMYIPWQGTGEQTTLLNSTSGYLTPFNMTCHKLMFRTPDVDVTSSRNIIFAIEKIDGEDTGNSIDSVCTYTESSLVDNTNFTISQSDWSANPAVDAGELVGISMTPSNNDIIASEKHFHITSLWRVEVFI